MISSAALLRAVRPSCFVACLAVLGALIGCDQTTKVKDTVPSSGEENVDPQTSIRVTFASTFNTKADNNSNLTDPTNFEVVGSLGGRYPGTVAVKTASQAAQDAAAISTASSSSSAAPNAPAVRNAASDST